MILCGIGEEYFHLCDRRMTLVFASVLGLKRSRKAHCEDSAEHYPMRLLVFNVVFLRDSGGSTGVNGNGSAFGL